MNNQIKTYHSDTGTVIHLKMKGKLLKSQIALSCFMLTFFDLLFLYLSYEAYINKEGYESYLAIFLILILLIKMHYDDRRNRKWVTHAEEFFHISKNGITISKKIQNQTLQTIEINTQTINEISYSRWRGGAYPPYLPDYMAGNIHLHTHKKNYSFGINLDKNEGEEFISVLRSLIMQYQEPRYFIFTSHLHLESNPDISKNKP